MLYSYNYNYSNNLSSEQLAGLGAGFGALTIFFIFIFIICIGVGVLQIIGKWKILKKAGKGGWEAIIPIYGDIVLCQTVGVSPWWILITFGICLVPFLGSFVGMAAGIYFSILLNVSLARSFGKEDSYAVGLILLAPFFYFALGISDSEYTGKNPMNDFLFKNLNNDSSKSDEFSYCAKCGTKIEKNVKFCPKCGEEIK